MTTGVKIKIVKLGAFYVAGIAPWVQGKREYQFAGTPTTKRGYAKAEGKKLAVNYARTLIY